jgi:hypothetical protein
METFVARLNAHHAHEDAHAGLRAVEAFRALTDL